MDQELLKRINSQLGGIYDPQTKTLQTQQAALPAQYDLERQGLEQAKKNAFRDISSKARGMGVAFGGYSPSQQARYTGATYLPAVADIRGRQTTATSALQQAINENSANRQNQAMDLYQAEIDRREQQRQFEAQLAASRAASASGGPSDSELRAIDMNAASQDLGSKTGADGYVSPQTYSTVKKSWISAGYTSKDFDTIFSAYRNPYSNDLANGTKRSLLDYGVF